MLYQKNLPGWERGLRVVAGLTLVGYALLAAPSTLVMAIALFSAVFVVGTGFVGYCPACAMVGRKSIQKDGSKH